MLGAYIKEGRLGTLVCLEGKGDMHWTGAQTDVCENCMRLAKEYMLWNAAGFWERSFFCPHCGFDLWVRKTEDFNNDLNWLGGV